MKFAEFTISTLPRIYFGEGRLELLPALIAEYGRRVLVVSGKSSFSDSPHWQTLQQGMAQAGLTHQLFGVAGEPSPALVDSAVREFHQEGFEVVVGIGGGSVLDAAKAIAGLLPSGRSVLAHLEDVGEGLPYEGPSLPFIAVPTTAGTGSEATRNAVLSEQGTGGYKKSFRHESLVARVALVDPLLLEHCPRELIAAQGMDAFTQLLESYVSLRANPFTDALAWSGLEAIAQGFFAAYDGGDDEAARQGRAAMAYGALLSGITLAQAGLGSVHGLAQPLGSLFSVPHGIACGTTLAVATEVNIKALRERAPQSPALAKYARVGRLLLGDQRLYEQAACHALVSQLQMWTERMAIPRLGQFGIGMDDLPLIIANARGNSMQTNPIWLSDEEIGKIVSRRV
ncbi:MAG: iron-containing alcohol dehydrogenase [Gammaproteobacteria bacterium]|nr:iron-containing alcohol dehydrogenase [Gammaproteobacteria bacterium]